MLPQFSKVMSRIAWISLYLAAAGLVTMTIIIGWQVWGRYILNNTPHWVRAFVARFDELVHIACRCGWSARKNFT